MYIYTIHLFNYYNMSFRLGSLADKNTHIYIYIYVYIYIYIYIYTLVLPTAHDLAQPLNHHPSPPAAAPRTLRKKKIQP